MVGYAAVGWYTHPHVVQQPANTAALGNTQWEDLRKGPVQQLLLSKTCCMEGCSCFTPSRVKADSCNYGLQHGRLVEGCAQSARDLTSSIPGMAIVRHARPWKRSTARGRRSSILQVDRGRRAKTVGTTNSWGTVPPPPPPPPRGLPCPVSRCREFG